MRYLIETIVALVDHKDDLEGYFKNASGNDHEDELLKWNDKITPKIRNFLGEKYSIIYKQLSGFTRPGSGSFYMLEPSGVSKWTEFILIAAVNIYVMRSIAVFRLLGHEFIIDWNDDAIKGIKLASKGKK